MCGFTKATLYGLDSLMTQTLQKGASKEKLKYLNTVDFYDNLTSQSSTLVGVASVGMLCQKMVFESLDELTAPNLLRGYQEDALVVSLQEHKIGIVMKNPEGENKLLLQVELNSARAKKRPLGMGDVNLLKICLYILFERLQKFVITTQTATKRVQLSDIIDFALRTARYESHKSLCRNLENDLVRLEDCFAVNALFLDRASNQLFTIAYTEDDDYRNTNQNLISMGLAKIQKLSQQNAKLNAGVIAAESKRIEKMKSDLELDMALRNMILNRNHMICIPSE